MKLWRLEAIRGLEDDPWDPWYDKAFSFVVRAENEEEARRVANDNGGSETGPVETEATGAWYRTGGDPWLDAKFTTCEELTAEGETGVIVRHLHHS